MTIAEGMCVAIEDDDGEVVHVLLCDRHYADFVAAPELNPGVVWVEFCERDPDGPCDRCEVERETSEP
jgi:hypothetical protein